MKPFKLSFNFFPEKMEVTKGSDGNKSIIVRYNYSKVSNEGKSEEKERLLNG